MKDTRILVKALREVDANYIQMKMAATLLAINGIENALEFVHKIPELNTKEAESHDGPAGAGDPPGAL